MSLREEETEGIWSVSEINVGGADPETEVCAFLPPPVLHHGSHLFAVVPVAVCAVSEGGGVAAGKAGTSSYGLMDRQPSPGINPPWTATISS